MLGPLVLLALAFSHKKSRGKWDTLVIMIYTIALNGDQMPDTKREIR
jgi:hypothetical protein